MRLGIKKKVLKKFQGFPETFQNNFFQKFPNGPVIVCFHVLVYIIGAIMAMNVFFSTRKSRQMILFYLHVYK